MEVRKGDATLSKTTWSQPKVNSRLQYLVEVSSTITIWIIIVHLGPSLVCGGDCARGYNFATCNSYCISYQQAAYRPNSDRARRSASPLVAPRAYISWTRKAGTPSTCARGGSTVAVAAPHPEGPQRWHVPGGICAVVPATTSYGWREQICILHRP